MQSQVILQRNIHSGPITKGGFENPQEARTRAGFMIVNWRGDPPTVKAGFVRDEQVQADYIEELVDLYKEEGIHGAFLYSFSEPRNIHTENPRTDLDMASYGLVKIVRGDTADEPEVWNEKLAFSRLAGAYGDSRNS